MIPMHLHDAWLSVRRNRNAVGAYILFNLIVNLAAAALDKALKPFVPEGNVPAWYPAYHIVSDVIAAAAIAGVTAIFLAEIGREIDRPLWKCGTATEAFKRFFLPWFIFNLAFVTIVSLQSRLGDAGNSDAVAALEFLVLLIQLLYIPVGACIMYGGGLHWDRLGELLAPIARMMPDSLLPIGLGFVQFCVGYAIASLSPDEIRDTWLSLAPSAVYITAGAFLECLAFAAMWRICMMHRDNPPENDDLF